MFFEMLFGYIIAFAIGALAMIVLMCYLVFDGLLIIEKTQDRKKRKEREEKEEKKKTENEKAE